jgi:hypothetical protein
MASLERLAGHQTPTGKVGPAPAAAARAATPRGPNPNTQAAVSSARKQPRTLMEQVSLLRVIMMMIRTLD